ncbi:hypothetical protein [Tardiphaga robiniae]|uniref:Uncharacterized protein n=1 Tax=Tardiphaga robiniae TaxID=943830 RepID=A0A7G6TTC3_9BRAD|nr:hypothetical protein [Tardiphaga robiniae]QND70005.1 hypothetical protein HB776_01175 [Tardiphaga robiniae]
MDLFGNSGKKYWGAKMGLLLTGAGHHHVPAAAPAPPSYSFRALSLVGGGVTSEPPTWNVEIGPASADRVVLVATGMYTYAEPYVVTCNGVELTPGPINNDTGNSIGFYYGIVPAGDGVVPITIQGSDATYFHEREICVWTQKGLRSNTPHQTSNNGNINFSQVTIPVVATDFLFVCISNNGAAPNFAANSTTAPTGERGGSVEATGDFIITATDAAFVANPGIGYGGIAALTFR